MLNKERVILMTRMASYEQNEGKKNMRRGNYFRSDYILVEVLKAVISATIAFVLIFALYILYDLENFMANIYKIDLLSFGLGILKYYIVTVVTYGALAYIWFTIRYAKTKKSLRLYKHNLKKLSSLYGEADNRN